MLLGVIEPIADAHGLEIVDASLKQGPGRAVVCVIVDTPCGDGQVGIGECARLSREIEHSLDASDLVSETYSLEISSPGVDRTLGRAIDFERVVGREVALETHEPLEGRRRFRGELVAFEEGAAQLRSASDCFSIPLGQIARAKAFHSGASARAKR